MLGKSAIASKSSSPSGFRTFVFEIEGWRQSTRTDTAIYDIRKSGSTFLQVPYNRMSETMQRINRMGGKIVSIKPADEAKEALLGGYQSTAK